MGKTELRLAREDWRECWPELAPLLAKHRLELGAHDGMMLDVTAINSMAELGILTLVTARRGQRLIGYILWTLGTALDRKGELIAELRPWYVVEEERKGGLGLRLFRASLEELRSQGVRKALPHHWGQPSLGKFFERLGARPLEWVYEMEL